MTTQTTPQTVERTHSTQPVKRKGAAAKLGALARAEWLQFRRNKVIMFMAVLVPLGIPALVVSQLFMGDEGLKPLGGALATEMFLMMSLLLVLFYSVLSMVTTRRDEGVLKRLRTGEAKDWQILSAIAVPGTIVVSTLFVVLSAGMFVLGMPLPENPAVLAVALIVALLVGVTTTVLLALISSGFTKNAEAAQITSMPVLILGMLSSASFREILPEGVRALAEKNPFGVVYDLVFLGWTGNAPADAMVGAAAMSSLELWTELGMLSVIAIVWIVLLAWSAKEYMRWDTHR